MSKNHMIISCWFACYFLFLQQSLLGYRESQHLLAWTIFIPSKKWAVCLRCKWYN